MTDTADPTPWVSPEGIRHDRPMLSCAGRFCEYAPRRPEDIPVIVRSADTVEEFIAQLSE